MSTKPKEKPQSKVVEQVKYYAHPRGFWSKPDKIDWLFVFMTAIFIVAIFGNIQFLASEDPILKENAVRMLGLMVMASFGIAVKGFFNTHKDVLKTSKGEVIIYGPVTETHSYLRGKSGAKQFGMAVLWGMVAFISLSFITRIIGITYSQSMLEILSTSFTFSIISAFTEEIFFNYAIQDWLMALVGVVSIPTVIFTFVYYHFIVYGGNVYALLYVAIGRTVYSIIYAVSKSISSVILAHLLNNFLAVMI